MVTERDMIGESDLAGEHHIVACAARTSDAGLAANQIVTTDVTIMSDLHQVIDLGSGTDSRDSIRAAVDRDVGTNVDI